MLRSQVKRKDLSVLNVKVMTILKMSMLITSYSKMLSNKITIPLTTRKTQMEVSMMKGMVEIKQLLS